MQYYVILETRLPRHVHAYVPVGTRSWVVLGEDLSCSALTSEILAGSWFNPDISLLTGFECDRAMLTVILLVSIPCKWHCGAQCAGT